MSSSLPKSTAKDHLEGLRGVVLWCDSDISVAQSATLFRDAGLEVRCLHEPEELAAEYAERPSEVVAIVSSMMESGGRKERGEMNAYELFAACREMCYDAGARVPVYAIISASADRPLSFKAGADAVVIGRREHVQKLVLRKLGARLEENSQRSVFWCDSADPSNMASKFSDANLSLETFTGVEEMVKRVEETDEQVAAIISSSMTSCGRAEAGLMSGFDGFASIREIIESKPIRPVFGIISGSGKAKDCYAAGADVAITKDNESRKRRHPSGSMWDHITKDVIAMLTAPPPKNCSAGVDTGSPSYWQNKVGDSDFSAMVPIHDEEVNRALQCALRDTFKRNSDGTAYSTRDRPPGENPKDFRLAQAYRIEDSHLWKTYAAFREKVGMCDDIAMVAGPGGPPKTASISGLPDLMPSANEAYLFHGTSPEAANGIINTGFRIDLAGTAAGCAFGKGAYLAEASTKSDEYSKNGQGIFSQMYAMLLCRVTLGRVARVEKFYHSSSEVRQLVDGIIANRTHDCLLGDREAAVGTYREFIVFSRDQIYPEFVLLYHRDS